MSRPDGLDCCWWLAWRCGEDGNRREDSRFHCLRRVATAGISTEAACHTRVDRTPPTALLNGRRPLL